MAVAKKSKKRNFSKINIQPITEAPAEALVFDEAYEAAFQAHMIAVDDFSKKIIDLMEKDTTDPVVAADALQILLLASVKTVMGEDASELLKMHLNKFQEESSVLQLLGFIKAAANEAVDVAR